MGTAEQPQPLFLAADLPGIFLPQAFRLQPADKNLVPASKTGSSPDTGNPPKEKVSGISFQGNPLVDALPFLRRTWSGPGFNQIFRPQSEKTPIPGQPASNNILELNLTQEIWTFGDKDLGDIPNRGSGQQGDVNLDGVPYIQSVVDVTSSLGGRLKIDRIGNLYDDSGNKIERTPQNDRPRNIHFETGIFLNVPRSLVNPDPGMARMACIPHGTTITLQGNAALLDKNPAPTFAKDNFTPFLMNVPLDPRKNKPTDPFNFREKPSQTITNNDAARLPRNLDRHRDSMSAVMKAPDVLMEEHNINKNITHTIAWRMGNSLLQKQSNPLQQAINILTKVTTILASTKSTDPDLTIEELKNVSGLLQKAANLSNIGFLDGTARDQLGDHTNASVATVTSIFWISRVEYTFKIEHDWTPSKGKDEKVTNTLRITPDKDLSGQPYAWGTVPEFCFPSDRPIKAQTVTVAASQIQYSQNVILNFQGLSWPHMSVATVAPLQVELELKNGSFTSHDERLWQDTLAAANAKAT